MNLCYDKERGENMRKANLSMTEKSSLYNHIDEELVQFMQFENETLTNRQEQGKEFKNCYFENPIRGLFNSYQTKKSCSKNTGCWSDKPNSPATL